MKRSVIGFLAAWALTLTAAGAVTIDDWIKDLRDGDNTARVRARQMLPRKSSEAVPKLLPLLASENAEAYWAAFRVLEDFCNAVSVPGREAERAEVTAHIMTLVAPEQPAAMKERGLRLLPLVVPEGYDVGPIAALLQDPELQEKARAALQDIGTPEATAALCAALPQSQPEFQCALLHALAMLKSDTCVPAALELTKSDDASVRAAAARALSWTGNPVYIPVLRAVRAQAEGATAFEATDALLRLADAMVRAGGNWDAAMAVYREVLTTDQDIVHRCGAIAGLGRFGDERVLDDILAAVTGPEGQDLEPAALRAFEELRGTAASQGLLDVYPQASPELQLNLLGIFGRKQDPKSLEVLSEAALSEDQALHEAALNALGDSALPGALEPVLAEVRKGTREERAAVANLERLARAYRAQNQTEGAGKAFLELYRAAESEEMRNEAIEGIKQFPTPDAFEVVMETMSEEERLAMPVGAMAGIAKALLDSDRKEEANTLIDALLPRIKTGQEAQEAIHMLAAGGSGSEWAHRLGFVNTWWLAGPFPWSSSDAFTKTNVGEPAVDLNATYGSGDKTVAWTRHETSDAAGGVNLAGIFGMIDNVCAYAFTRIEVAEGTDAILKAGSDDGIKIWVNGEAVHENNVDRPMAIDEDQAPARLKAGRNDILVEATQGAGGWNFCLRLTTADGGVLAFAPAE